ncbi:MAG: hypothetical protein QMC70_01810 [Bacteroidia bacterium]|jgi:hypothetical protein|tara:strand:+ start:169 stop:696 length:528 start_codon:yes stop_codon:yes gene_type:complete
MKKVLFILTVAAMFAACNEDSTTPGTKTGTTNSASMVGNWNFTKLVQANGRILIAGQEISTFTSESSDENGNIQFTEEGQFGSNFGYKSSISTLTAGIPSSNEEQVPPTALGGTYEHNTTAGTFTITAISGEVTLATINELTSSRLVYTAKLNRSVTNLGITTTTTSDVTTTFTK